ncbi:unnamed protein product [Closterium sp. Naga37s-1]|nr:unnamed protein product [Closterium sp. Naga37s-1]
MRRYSAGCGDARRRRSSEWRGGGGGARDRAPRRRVHVRPASPPPRLPASPPRRLPAFPPPRLPASPPPCLPASPPPRLPSSPLPAFPPPRLPASLTSRLPASPPPRLPDLPPPRLPAFPLSRLPALPPARLSGSPPLSPRTPLLRPASPRLTSPRLRPPRPLFFVPTLRALAARPSAVGLLVWCAALPQADSIQHGARCALHILCLSSGNAEGLGSTRRAELKAAAATLGIAQQCVEVVDHPQLQDGMDQSWPSDVIAGFVTDFVKRHQIKTLLTFDAWGVSGHPNHRAISHALRCGIR